MTDLSPKDAEAIAYALRFVNLKDTPYDEEFMVALAKRFEGEAPTEVLTVPQEHELPGQDEQDPLSRIATAVEIGSAAMVDGVRYLQAWALRDPAITAELRRREREARRPTPPPPPSS